MGNFNLQIQSYVVQLYREKTTTLGGSTFTHFAYIQLNCGDWTVLIRFLAPNNPPKSGFVQEISTHLNRLFLYVKGDKLNYYLDLLRNEKPVKANINTTSPDESLLFTGAEPVGEGET